MENTRKITFSYNNGEFVFSLYVNPRSLRVSRPHNVKRFVSIDGKELSLSAGEGLRRVSITTFLPKKGALTIANADFTEPEEIISLLKSWQDSRKPMRLAISGSDINEAFLIEDVSETFYEGDEDVEITVKLVQYRFVTALLTETGGDRLYEREAGNSETARTHTVKKGDTLWAISKMYYGTPYRWSELKERNGVKDVRKLRIGQVLAI